MVCDFLGQRHFIINILETFLIKVIFHNECLFKRSEPKIGSLCEFRVVLVLGASLLVLVQDARFLNDVLFVTVWDEVVRSLPSTLHNF